MEIGNYFHAMKLNSTTVANQNAGKKVKKQRKSVNFFLLSEKLKKMQEKLDCWNIAEKVKKQRFLCCQG